MRPPPPGRTALASTHAQPQLQQPTTAISIRQAAHKIARLVKGAHPRPINKGARPHPRAIGDETRRAASQQGKEKDDIMDQGGAQGEGTTIQHPSPLPPTQHPDQIITLSTWKNKKGQNPIQYQSKPLQCHMYVFSSRFLCLASQENKSIRAS